MSSAVSLGLGERHSAAFFSSLSAHHLGADLSLKRLFGGWGANTIPRLLIPASIRVHLEHFSIIPTIDGSVRIFEWSEVRTLWY